MKAKLIGYWIATGLFCFAMMTAGILHFWGGEDMVKMISDLELPPYFAKVLGFWKIAGGVALLVPGFALLKEWAYAGFFFNLTGAVAVHCFVNHPLTELIAPIILLGIGACSWYLRPDSRKLAGII